MREASLVLCVVLLGSVASGAQFKPCKFENPVSVGATEGVSVQRLSIVEGDQKYAATVLVPNDTKPVPAIIFSHSRLDGSDSTVDLLRFGMGLSQAGAAVIVLDGTITWTQPNDDSERSPHLWACAGQWLLSHLRIDRKRLAMAGPNRHWGGGDTPHCMAGESPCWSGAAWMNFGQTSPAELANTDYMLREGSYRMAEFAQRQLKLRPVQARWLTLEKIRP